MAAKHSHSLSRVGRLRSALVVILRKNFARQSEEAEKSLGMRLSDVDDEMLVAYLDAFAALAQEEHSKAGVKGLREALNMMRIPVEGDDILGWIDEVHRLRQQGWILVRKDEQDRFTPEKVNVEKNIPPEQRAVAHHDKEELFTEQDREDMFADLERQQGITNKQPSETDLDKHWDVEPQTEPKEPKQDSKQSTEEKKDGGLAALFSKDAEKINWDTEPLGDVHNTDDNTWEPSPVKGPDKPVEKKAGPAATAPQEENERKTRRETAKQNTDNSSKETQNSETQNSETQNKDSVNAADKSQTKKENTERKQGREETQVQTSSGTEEKDENGFMPPDVLSTDIESLDAPKTQEETVKQEEEEETLADLFETQDKRKETFTPALKPEIMQQQRKRNEKAKGKKPRVTAVPAKTLFGDDEPDVELSDELRDSLMAAVSIPRPVFTQDLISIAGSSELTDAWEQECRNGEGNVKVRFIVPKSRHRSRGRLVVLDPKNISGDENSWWKQCIHTYRSGRLYELGVLLKRVGDEVVSHTFRQEGATLKLSTNKGLVGLVVCFDSDLDKGSKARNYLERELTNLASERLVLLGVLTTSGERGAFEDLVSTLETVTHEKKLKLTAPLVAAKSWEYADDRGSSAVVVSS